MIVFALGQMLPGDVGRNVLGGFASQESVDAFNKERGLDRPAGRAVPRLGQPRACAAISARRTPRTSRSTRSSRARSPSRPSSRCFAFVIMLPLAFLGGLLSALKAYKGDGSGHQHRRSLAHRRAGVRLGAARDRRLRHRPRVAARVRPLARGRERPRPAGVPPAARLVLVGVLFGYVSRMVRAGTIEALDADYTRTAYLKGLGMRTVMCKHVLRNALLPDDRRRRDADRLPARRARDRRARLQLPGDGPGDRQPRGAQGLSRSCRRAPW